MKYKAHKQYRLQNRLYDEESYYFITICTKNREHFFGEIIENEGKIYLKPTRIGEIVAEFIQEVPKKNELLTLDSWVVMPNHVHLILLLGEGRGNTVWEIPKLPFKKTFTAPVSGSISSSINHFKRAVTFWCKTNEFRDFAWQSRFHDHVIRNAESLTKIQNYIEQNPKKWLDDVYNLVNDERYQKFVWRAKNRE